MTFCSLCARRTERRCCSYVILEHKSQSDRFDVLQLLEQVVAVLCTHRREHSEDRYLPPVLPVVVHADHRPWRSPLQLRELFDLPSLPADLVRYLPAFEFVLDDLHDKPPAMLRDRALTAFGLCALSTLQYLPAASRDLTALGAWIDEWADVHEQAEQLAQSTGRDVYEAVVNYIIETSALPQVQLQRVLQRRLTARTMKNFLSTADQIRAEGKTEGRSQGRVDLLLRLIRKRFGDVDGSALRAHLQNAHIDDLDRYGERLLDAVTLADVFAE